MHFCIKNQIYHLVDIEEFKLVEIRPFQICQQKFENSLVRINDLIFTLDVQRVNSANKSGECFALGFGLEHETVID